jgi:ubiquitin-like 1-activating enzyme E1 B
MTAAANPLSGLEKTVGKDLLHKIQTSKLLLVGSGGIGCELLKDLALSGFRHVQVIDLDTIDISNLNRQLLFRSQHVGMAKCTVACQVAADMVPPCDHDDDDSEDTSSLPPISYQAHHGNVCDTTQFNVPFVKAFDLVLNALDNVEARRRVNRLCLAANVPLIEAGTTGYLGQVTVIHKESNVACYECVTQETQKVYPICTIRSTPSMPVHTIVWAKECYKLLCHSNVEESMLFEDTEGDEPSTYMEVVRKVRGLLLKKPDTEKSLKSAIQELLQALFGTEIQKQLDMGRYKAAKKTPTVLDADILEQGMSDTSFNASSATSIWSLPQCIAQIVDCLCRASQEDTVVLESFDKDDDLSMRFVTAASNLRSHVFAIEPLQSLYSAKGIAGNIIPAIATTNAICAGLQILQAFQILKAQLEAAKENKNNTLNLQDKCCYVNCLRNKTRNGLFLTASKLEAPNPNCFVCKNATIPLTLNVNEWTLELFLQKVVKQRLGFESPTLLLQGDFIWEEGEGADNAEFQPNLSKTLATLPCGGIQNGTILEIDDATQNLTIQVAVTHQEEWEPKQGEEEVDDHPFVVGATPKSSQPAAAAKPAAAANNDEEDDDDEVLVVEENEDDHKKPAAKRSTPESNIPNGGEPPAKKAKVDDDHDVIEVD